MFHRKDSTNISWAPNVSLSTIYPRVNEQFLELTVVFTTVRATLAALKEAGNLAHQLQARIRIIAPQVVPYALPIEHPPVDPLFKIRKVRTLCCTDKVGIRIEVRLCRDAQKCVQEALGPESVVLIGGRKRLWPTRAGRLAQNLCRAGHHVIFVTAK
jgi:hypothetical protein